MAVEMRFDGSSIPAIYDADLGPVTFTPYARLLLEHCQVASLAPSKVLEIGCGTGRLTSELLLAIPGASITSTDLSEGMLLIAKSRVSSPALTWQQMDLSAIAFPDASFDLVISSFTYMLAPDFNKAFAEARRVLKPGGSFIFSVWDKSPFFDILCQTLAKHLPEEPAAKIIAMSAMPYTLRDTHHVSELLKSAGFVEVRAHHAGILTTDTTSLARGLIFGTPFSVPFGDDRAALDLCHAEFADRLGDSVESSATFYHATA